MNRFFAPAPGGKPAPTSKGFENTGELVRREAIEFLDSSGPPWWGDSSYDDVEKIKELCCKGAPDPPFKYRCYRGKRKAERTGDPEVDTPRWGTKDIVSLHHLLQSGIWKLLGAPSNAMAYQALLEEVSRCAKTVEAERELARAKAEEEERRRIDEKCEKDLAATTQKSGNVLNAEQRLEKQRERDREGASVHSTKDELDRLAALGMHPELVENTITMGDFSLDFEGLGPATGISAAGRILRVMRFQRTRVRVNNPEIYFDPAALEPLYVASDKRVAEEIILSVRDPSRMERQLKAHSDKKARQLAKAEAAVQAQILAEQSQPMEVDAPPAGVEAVQTQPAPGAAKTMTPAVVNYKGPPAPVICGDCLQRVESQFLECSIQCSAKPGFLPWRICPECNEIVHPKLRVTRGCACSRLLSS